MAVDMDTSVAAAPRIGRAQRLFDTRLVLTPNIDQYAPSADGTRFLLRRPIDSESRSQVHLIVNWPSLLEPR